MSKQDEAGLILKLYELRREETMRTARDWIAIEGCTAGEATAAPDLDGRFVAVTWTLQCSAAPDELDVDLTGFFAADRRHEAIVHVSHSDAPIVIRADAPRWTIPVGKPGIWRGWWAVIPASVVGVALGALLMRQMRR